jgi:hypothetical protein
MEDIPEVSDCAGFIDGSRVSVTVVGIQNMAIFPDQGCPAGTLAMVPFQLGGAFKLLFTHSLYLDSDGRKNESNGVSSLGGFRLFEADGITPVAAFATEPIATPEPGSMALVAVGIAWLLSRRRNP